MSLHEYVIGQLKPCPLCGEKDDFMIASRLRKLRPYDKEWNEQQMDYWIECNQCGCKFGTNAAEIDQNIDNEHGYDYDFVEKTFEAIDKLIRGWNRRAAE